MAESKTTLPPAPWKVYSTKLRQQFPTKIIEIHDVNGAPIIAWTGFDSLDMSHAKKLAIAKVIVECVNAKFN